MADKTHPKMQRAERAKQFMPFDALKGFREALAEKERVTVPKKEFSEEYSAGLDGRLRRIRRKDFVTAEYYRDGEYVRVTGEVTGISAGEQVLVVSGSTARKAFGREDVPMDMAIVGIVDSMEQVKH